MNNKLSISDFDEHMNLINPNFQGPVVILFWAAYCPHCTAFHPTFTQAAEEAAKDGILFLEVHTPDNQDLSKRIAEQADPQFLIDGVPTVVSYLNGQYYSTYGQGKFPERFRTLNDTLQYARTIGTAPIVYV